MITRTDADDATRILTDVRDLQSAEQAAAAAILARAADWADLHPAQSRATAATVTHRGEDLGYPIAGQGAPLVEVTCVAEFAAALHLTTESGQSLVGDALELRHRLPLLWSLVQDLRVPAWKARRVAGHTISLNREAAGFVDRQVAACVGAIGPRQLDRLIEETIARYMPEEAERRRVADQEQRCFTVEHNDGINHLSGQSRVYGVLDLVDALDLDAAISEGARQLRDLGCTDTLNVRRARAAGDLARRQPGLDLAEAGSGHEPTATAAPRARQVTLYLHLSDTALTGGSSVGRIGNTQCPVTTEQIRDWCGQLNTQLTVKPVIDLDDQVSVTAYEIPDRIRERIGLRDQTCVFPWCTRPVHPAATRLTRDGQPVHPADCDHIVPHDADGPPGQTSTANLAPLCRRHHRLKTFTGWRYRVHDRPGAYAWTSPHGLTFLRDHTGTHETTPTHPITA